MYPKERTFISHHHKQPITNKNLLIAKKSKEFKNNTLTTIKICFKRALKILN